MKRRKASSTVQRSAAHGAGTTAPNFTELCCMTSTDMSAPSFSKSCLHFPACTAPRLEQNGPASKATGSCSFCWKLSELSKTRAGKQAGTAGAEARAGAGASPPTGRPRGPKVAAPFLSTPPRLALRGSPHPTAHRSARIGAERSSLRGRDRFPRPHRSPL